MRKINIISLSFFLTVTVLLSNETEADRTAEPVENLAPSVIVMENSESSAVLKGASISNNTQVRLEKVNGTIQRVIIKNDSDKVTQSDINATPVKGLEPAGIENI